VGQLFVPFDRARTSREFALQLADRQQVVTELNLDRDVGVMLFSPDLLGLGGRLAYSLGIFGGQGRNPKSSKPLGFLYVGRISVRPFGAFDDDNEGDLARSPELRIAIGLAAAYNHRTTRQRSTTGPALTLGGFNYLHLASDVVVKYHGFSFLGEALLRRANVALRDKATETVQVREWSRSGYGYLLQAGMMVSDAVELAARWDVLFAMRNTDPTLEKLASERGRELGGGINWYLNGHSLKLQADYTARFGRGTIAALHLVRLQLDATF
jgi:hypothetical protein